MPTPLHTAGDTIVTALTGVLASFLTFIPRLLGACLILLVGFFAGRFVGRLVTRSLRLLRFDQIAERAEIRSLLGNIGVRLDPAAAVGVLAQWSVYLIALQAAAGALGFPQVTQVLNEIGAFLPRAALAIIILLLGALAANLLARAVRGGASAGRIADGDLLASLVRWGIVIFSVVAALSQLEIAPAIVNTLWVACIGGTALALALAFGLGSRDVLGSLAAGRLIKADLAPGMEVDIGGQEGTIERIGAIFTTVNAGERRLYIPNRELMRGSLSTRSGRGAEAARTRR